MVYKIHFRINLKKLTNQLIFFSLLPFSLNCVIIIKIYICSPLSCRNTEGNYMKFVIQRVKNASVTIDGKEYGAIGLGLMVLCGIADSDDEAIADKMVKKLCNLRIFEDEQGKTNLSLADVNGELMIISQFTLYADCRKGNRPSFIKAGKPETASPLYEYILTEAGKYVPDVKRGIFGADMKITLLNDGPFTIVLDSEDIV